MELHSLGNIVNEALVMTEAKSKRHNVSLFTEFYTNTQILCDEIEIEQVIVNLIYNGI